MSDAEGVEMSQQEAAFILQCCRSVIGGVMHVDPLKIATDLGYTNPRSVTNKIGAIKKKFDLPISTAGAKSHATTASIADAIAAPAPAIARTPTPAKAAKGKVTKKPATPRKTPTKKIPKSVINVDVEEEDTEMDENPADA